ncbi:MAG: MMPL family transporter, partial [Dermatophilaceae bacterium]
MHRIATTITRRWVAGPLAVAALLVAVALTAVVGQAEQPPVGPAALPGGTDSRAAAELLDRLPEAAGSSAVILFSREGQRLSDDDLALVRARAAALPGATGAPLTVSEDGTAAVVVVPVDDTTPVATSERVSELRLQARDRLPDGLYAQITGPAGVQADLAGVFDGANTRLLGATAAVVALLLVITYRSPVLW